MEFLEAQSGVQSTKSLNRFVDAVHSTDSKRCESALLYSLHLPIKAQKTPVRNFGLLLKISVF